MKNTRTPLFLSLIIAGTAAASCGNTERPNLSGQIELDRDTLLIQIISAEAPKGQSVIDTVVLDNGRFETVIPDSTASFIYFIPKPKSESEMMSLYPVRTLFLPGDNMKVSGTLDELEISGTELYDALAKTEYRKLERERDAVHKAMKSLYTDADANKAEIDSLRNTVTTLDERLNETRMELVRSEPDNIASGYAMLFLPAEQAVEAYGLLGESVKNGRMKPVLDYINENNINSVLKKKNWEKLTPGSPAPDFRLMNLDGEYMTLSSFRGKYILLDFWGTWCGWCIKGLPEMKEYYAKYKDKIEFVGIDCRDTEEKWREGVSKYGLEWTNLYNGNATEAVIAYGIQGYPSKIIIDPQGNVVETFLGEDPQLYKRLDELF